MSKYTTNYSKWDDLDTDDSDAEPPAPEPEPEPEGPGWRAHADPVLAVKELSKLVLSYELEDVFDAQAFDKGTPRAKRALRCVLKGNLARLNATLAWGAGADADFETYIKPNLTTTECCYVLFRTKTWALFVWAPACHVEADAYLATALPFREALGGNIRIPNVFSWTKHGDVRLDAMVTDAPALSLSAADVEGAVSAAARARGPAVPASVPDPLPPMSAM